MNRLFNMDDWSDEFGTEMGMRACVMAAMRDPHNYKTDKAAARLAQSCMTFFTAIEVRLTQHNSTP